MIAEGVLLSQRPRCRCQYRLAEGRPAGRLIVVDRGVLVRVYLSLHPAYLHQRRPGWQAVIERVPGALRPGLLAERRHRSVLAAGAASGVEGRPRDQGRRVAEADGWVAQRAHRPELGNDGWGIRAAGLKSV